MASRRVSWLFLLWVSLSVLVVTLLLLVLALSLFVLPFLVLLALLLLPPPLLLLLARPSSSPPGPGTNRATKAVGGPTASFLHRLARCKSQLAVPTLSYTCARPRGQPWRSERPPGLWKSSTGARPAGRCRNFRRAATSSLLRPISPLIGVKPSLKGAAGPIYAEMSAFRRHPWRGVRQTSGHLAATWGSCSGHGACTGTQEHLSEVV